MLYNGRVLNEIITWLEKHWTQAMNLLKPQWSRKLYKDQTWDNILPLQKKFYSNKLKVYLIYLFCGLLFFCDLLDHFLSLLFLAFITPLFGCPVLLSASLSLVTKINEQTSCLVGANYLLCVYSFLSYTSFLFILKQIYWIKGHTINLICLALYTFLLTHSTILYSYGYKYKIIKSFYLLSYRARGK